MHCRWVRRREGRPARCLSGRAGRGSRSHRKGRRYKTAHRLNGPHQLPSSLHVRNHHVRPRQQPGHRLRRQGPEALPRLRGDQVRARAARGRPRHRRRRVLRCLRLGPPHHLGWLGPLGDQVRSHRPRGRRQGRRGRQERDPVQGRPARRRRRPGRLLRRVQVVQARQR